MKLFSEVGYEPTSMRKLADAVGMKASSLYNHFNSKDAILVDLVRQNGPGSITFDLDEILSKNYVPQKILNEFLDLAVDRWMQRETVMLMSIFAKLPGNHPAKNLVNDGVDELKAKLTACFSAWIDEGSLAKEHSAEFYFFTYMAPLLYTRNMMTTSSQELEQLESMKDMCKTHVNCFVEYNFR